MRHTMGRGSKYTYRGTFVLWAPWYEDVAVVKKCRTNGFMTPF